MDDFLNWKIPLFNQTVKEFFTSKTNWIGLAMLVGSVYLLFKNAPESAAWLATNAIGLLGIRDALAKAIE